MEGCVESRELEPEGIVPGDDARLGGKALISLALGERLTPMRIVGRSPGQDVVTQAKDVLRPCDSGPCSGVG